MVKAILIIDGKEVNVRWFTINFNQGANPNGRPSQIPVFIGFKLIIETRKDLNLTEWAFSSRQTKQIVLHISSVIVGGKTRKIFFYDCHLVNWKTNFSSTGSDPMTETLEITCAGVEDSNSFGVYSASWRTTFKEDTVEPTVLERPEPTFLGYHFENENREKLEQEKIQINQNIVLIIETENGENDTISINLNDNRLDFEYNGVVLINDTLNEVIITGQQTEVILKAVAQQN